MVVWWTNYNIPHNGRNLKLSLLYLKRIFRFETIFSIWSYFFVRYEANFSCDLKLNPLSKATFSILTEYYVRSEFLGRSKTKYVLWTEIFDLNIHLRFEANFFCAIWSEICYLKRNQLSETKFSKRFFVVFNVSKH